MTAILLGFLDAALKNSCEMQQHRHCSLSPLLLSSLISAADAADAISSFDS